VRPVAWPAATTTTMAVAPDANVLIELRRWMANRLAWHPS
jgi:hypothetical protein